MKKKANRKYMTTRVQYKVAKTYDHGQFDAFCANIYTEGFKDGEKSTQGVETTDIMEHIKTIKGIGEKRLAQIEQVISELLGKSKKEDKTE